MNIEIKVDEKYTESKVIIYTHKINEEITSIIDSISTINQKTLKAYKDENIDIKILGTLTINFKDGNKSYASRRYIPKIKKFLEI